MSDRDEELVRIIVELAENCGVAGAVRDRLTEREESGHRMVANLQRMIDARCGDAAS